MNRLISKLLLANSKSNNNNTSTAESSPSSSTSPSTTTSNSENHVTPTTSASSQSADLHPLITQTLVDTKKYFCPFLDRGFCRESTRCNFSHTISNSTRIPNDYCHFYLANQCLYGRDCKFRHGEPDPSETSSRQLDTHHGNPENAQYNNTCGEEEQGWKCAADVIHPQFSSSDQSASDLDNSLRDIPRALEELDADQLEILKNYPLCPYSSTTGECQYQPEECSYIHGLICDLCGTPCLHPYDTDQQSKHREDCLREHEREMELSFAVQRSRDKVCGICMDTVVEKQPITSSRFGILEKCNHIFCLDCIRKWRGTKQFDSRTIRACPECRVSSDFVVPSKYWVEDQDDKEKLIHDYKIALRSKPCKYFNEGKGDCPFAGSCFYKHAFPDGTLAKLDGPKPKRRSNGNRGLASAFTDYILWSIYRQRDGEDSTDDDLESLFQPIERDPFFDDGLEFDDDESIGYYDLVL